MASFAGDKALELMEASCGFWSRWVTTYLERTNIRINLTHNLLAQQDNQLNQQISNLTTDIALQTQHDGISMFTLAMVTVAFLPGTFICVRLDPASPHSSPTNRPRQSILSTVFFSYDASRLSISQWWWILPCIGIPLTLMVLYLWIFWSRARLRRNQALLQARSVYLEPSVSEKSSIVLKKNQ